MVERRLLFFAIVPLCCYKVESFTFSWGKLVQFQGSFSSVHRTITPSLPSHESTWTAELTSDDDAKSQFGTRQYWNEVYVGQGDFPKEEYSWYFGWDTVKPFLVEAVPSKESQILLPGVGNDPLLLDLFRAGYKNLVAFDYSEHAIERQRDLLWYEPRALDQLELHHMDARKLDPEWTDRFDAVLEKGALDAIYLSGDDNVELAVTELKRVLRPGGVLISISGVVPEERRRHLFADWRWVRDGTDDLQAGCFILVQTST